MHPTGKWSIIRSVLVVTLILGILPSFVALSDRYARAWPEIFRVTGPLNVLKWLLPLIVAWTVYGVRRQFSPIDRKTTFLVFGAWIVGSLSATVAAYRCGLPPLYLREWAVLTIGLLVGVAFSYFDSKSRDRVFVGWFALVAFAILLDVLFPMVIDSLYARVFDPNTRNRDMAELGVRALTGFFGRQSLAKLMAWLPWLVLPAIVCERGSRLVSVFFGAVVFSGAILATSQRGPTLAAFIAAVVFLLHRGWRTSDRRWYAAVPAAAVIFILSIATFVPKAILAPRVFDQAPPLADMRGEARETRAGQVLVTARDNSSFRKKILSASAEWIASHPLGSACIPNAFFAERGVIPAHAHNLFLEQFRSRGWVWGLFHVFLWLIAGIGYLRGTDVRSSAYMAAWTAIVVSGLFDHPWFVISQAIVVGVVLVGGIREFCRSASENPRS